jgi:hypothetical protein
LEELTVGEIDCYSMIQKQTVESENSMNNKSIPIGFFSIKETINYEFVTLKQAVNQASFFQIWNIYCNISVEKDQICGQTYALF